MDEKIMQRWDEWRKYIAGGGTASWPRDEFEGLIGGYKEQIKELEEERDTLRLNFEKMVETASDQIFAYKGEQKRVKQLEEHIKCITKELGVLKTESETKVKELEFELENWKDCNLYPRSYRDAIEKIKELEATIAKIKSDPSIGKLEVEDWPETPNY